MTDPLGQGQVINYLIGLRKYGYDFDILSCEKPDKFAKLENYIRNLLQEHGIGWYPIPFHSFPPILSKVYDRTSLWRKAKKLQKNNNYDLVHCRSYVAAEIGLRLKRTFGTKFLFDMRGFWADEKADGGSWNRKKWFWEQIYQFYKKKEKEFILDADYIISLTHAGREEIQSWPFVQNDLPIEVIPCCASASQFALTSIEKKLSARELTSIPKEAFVLSYLGSLGSWYMIDEMLEYFSLVLRKYGNAYFLILTNSAHEIVSSRCEKYKIPLDRLRIFTIPFTRVPSYMYASDISLSFIKPVYSKMSSSPIKIGEVLSMGIPVLANDIGDSGTFVREHKVGHMLPILTTGAMQESISQIDALLTIDPAEIRDIAIGEYSAEIGIERYKKVYASIISKSV